MSVQALERPPVARGACPLGAHTPVGKVSAQQTSHLRRLAAEMLMVSLGEMRKSKRGSTTTDGRPDGTSRISTEQPKTRTHENLKQQHQQQQHLDSLLVSNSREPHPR